MIRDPPLPSRRDPTSPGSAERYEHGKNDCFHPKMVKKIENNRKHIIEHMEKLKGESKQIRINGCKWM